MSLYSMRLSAQRVREKRILLQLSEGLTALPIILAAWSDGWSVAVIREETPSEHLRALRKKLGPHLYFVLRVNPLESFVDTGKLTLPLGEWLRGEKKAVEPYSWAENECALILFTSGSTGAPKGVCHSLGNLIDSAKLFTAHFELKESDHLLCLAPLHSMSGFRSTVLPLVTSARVSMLWEKDASFLSIIKRINILRPTHIICAPVFIRQLAAYGRRVAEAFTSVRALLCTGAALDETDRGEVESLLSVPVLNYYGLTETSGIVLAETVQNRRPYTLPPTCEGVKIRLVRRGKRGTGFYLLIESPNLFLGYLGEALSCKRLFNTGDIVQKDADGGLRLKGRSSSALKAPSTEWIYPDLLKSWLLECEDILDAVVKPSKVAGGYGLEVWVKGRSGLDADGIADSIVTELGREYRPVKWHSSMIMPGVAGQLGAES